jgi:hypothetical protein
LWLPAGVGLDQVRDLWLQSTRETADKAARAYAVMGREIPDGEAGWVIYMAKHDSKSAKAQEVDEGKHWGWINRAVLSQHTPLNFEMSPVEHSQVLRLLRRHREAQMRTDVQRLHRRYVDALSAAASKAFGWDCHVSFDGKGYVCWTPEGMPLGHWDSHREFRFSGLAERAKWLALRRAKVRTLHRGDLLQLVRGDVALRIINGIRGGAIYGQRPGDPF